MQQDKMQWLAILVLILLITGVGAILQMQTAALRDTQDAIAMLTNKTGAQPQEAGDEAKPAPKMAASELFDPTTDKVGDVVAGMTLMSLAPGFSQTGGTFATEDSVRAQFSGEVTLSGTFYVSEPGFDEGGTVSFSVTDVGELRKLPRVASSLASGSGESFYFVNQELANKLLSAVHGSKGTATITIRDYMIVNEPTDAFDSATLVEVLEKSKTSSRN